MGFWNSCKPWVFGALAGAVLLLPEGPDSSGQENFLRQSPRLWRGGGPSVSLFSAF